MLDSVVYKSLMAICCRLGLLLYCLVSAEASAEEFDFLQLNKAELAQRLFDEIERLDANAIYVRNKTKSVKWPEFRAAMTRQIIQADSKKSLAMAIDNVQHGFTNSHAAIQPYPVLYDVPALYKDAPDKRGFKLGFTSPDISFFSLTSHQSVSYVNGIDLADRFYQFEQYECQFAHQNACLNKFVDRVRYGWARLNIKDEVNLQGSDGEQWLETVVSPTPNSNSRSKGSDNYCADYAKEYPAFILSYAGANVCLLTKANTALLRIRSFGAWGAAQDDFYCYNEAEPASLCHDVQMLSKALSERKQLRLVVDLQDNSGGSENTPLLALFSANGFNNSVIQYRYTEEMQDDTFRNHMFYGVERAQKWFSTIDVKQLQLTEKQWLPVRTDFCRGSEECADVIVPPRAPALDIQQLVVVVNSGCFSSCDDLAWRLKRDAKAYVIGQPPVTDATYASASGVIYLTPQGELKSKIVAPGQVSGLSAEMIKLLWFRVPYTTTLNDKQERLEGNSAILDYVISISTANFNNINTENVNKAISLLAEK